MESKIGRNKKACEKYRLSGHKQENKELRQKRHESRMEHFAQRREEGKAYEYKSIPYANGTSEWFDEKYERAAKNVSNKTPFQKITSIMRKLDNELTVQRVKAKEAKGRRGQRITKTV